MLRKLITLLLVASLAGFPLYSQKKTDKTTIQQQKQATTKKLKQNTKKLEQNKAETSKKLRELSLVQEEIKSLNSELKNGTTTLDSLKKAVSCVTDTINDYNQRLENLSNKYANALRHQQGNFQSVSAIAYLFSSKDVSQALRKYRALKNFAKWRERKAGEIETLKIKLEDRRLELGKLKERQASLVSKLDARKKDLENSEATNKKLIADLNKKGNEIKSIIEQDRKQLEELNKALEKLIAEEQARIAEEKRKEEERLRAEEQKRLEEERLAAERQKAEEQEKLLARQNQKKRRPDAKKKKEGKDKTQPVSAPTKNSPAENTPQNNSNSGLTARNVTQLSSGFLAAKGKLPYPVDGRHVVVRGFGRQKHPDLPLIETDNPGIDISVDRNATARAIYEGTVSAIFKQPGYNNIVMVRHGDYITIYANLTDISVSKGERIAPGRALGRIAVDEDDSQGRSIIHFEIRHEKEKENPLLWLK